MKRQMLLALALSLALPMGAISGESAVQAPAGERKEEGRRHRGGRGEAIAARLKLTDDQRKKFEAVATERKEKMKALHSEFMEKRKALNDESDSKISAMLNAEQKAEFSKMKEDVEKRRDDFKSRRGHKDDPSEPSDDK